MKLRQHLAEDEILTVDARQSDAIEQVIQAQPTAVILEAADVEVARHAPMSALLTALPNLTIIRLDAKPGQVQVVTAAQHEAAQVQDLLDVIRGAGRPA